MKKYIGRIFILITFFEIYFLPGSLLAATYEVIDLGAVHPMDINNQGQVAVVSDDAYPRSFLWEEGVMTDLNISDGSSWNIARGINDFGQIVGASANGPYLWESGTIRNLDSMNEVYAINDSGQVVGEATIHINNSQFSHPFLWENGITSDLGTLGPNDGYYSHESYCGYATDINNAGQVVGYSNNEYHQSNAFLWDNGNMRNLGTLGGYSSIAYGVNDSGQVVGSSLTDNSGYNGQAFLWQNGIMTDLNPMSHEDTYARDINNFGQVVGYSVDDNNYYKERALLWENGSMVDLNTLLPENSGWELTHARAINDAGDIVGWGEYYGENHGFLLTSPKEYYAIMIGMDNWQNDIDSLSYNLNNFNGWNNSSTSHYTLLKNPTEQQIVMAIENVKNSIRPQDEFLFYYSGHGSNGLSDMQIEPTVLRQDGVLTNQDESLYSGLRQESFLCDDTLEGLFSDAKWNDVEKSFIFDCCLASGFWGSGAPGNSGQFSDIFDLASLENIRFLGACAESEFTTGIIQDLNDYLFLENMANSNSGTSEDLNYKRWFEYVAINHVRHQVEVYIKDPNYDELFTFDSSPTYFSNILADQSWATPNGPVISPDRGANPVPEPATMLLFGPVLAGLLFSNRKRS